MVFVKKILGIVLLLTGLVVIIYSLYSSYVIFTAKKEAPVVFEISEQLSAVQKGNSQDIQAQMEKVISEQLKGILPVDSITELFNLIAWSIFAGILIFGGAQISSLGIKLLK